MGLPVGVEAPDPALESLADALRVSFWLLKLVMLLLVVAYLFSGVFSVREQERAVRLRFGRIVSRGGGQVLEPGGPYFAMPYPIEQVIRIPTAPHQIRLNTEFWYESPAGGPGQAGGLIGGKPGPLNPEKDGSLLTGDGSLIHARWSVTYTVDRPVDFVKHVKDAATAERLVRDAAEQGIIFAAAQLPANKLMKSQNLEIARSRAQAALDAVASGVRITTLSIKDPVFPLSVRSAVQAVLDAQSERAKMVEEAQEQWSGILAGSAGEAYRPLLELIDRYTQADQRAIEHDSVQAKTHENELDGQLDGALDKLAIETGGRVLEIGGEVARIIHQARTYRTEVVTTLRGEVDYFQSLLPQYRDNPRLLINRLSQETMEKVLTGDNEVFYLSPGRAYLELNRDPKVQQARERKRLSAEADSDRATSPAE